MGNDPDKGPPFRAEHVGSFVRPSRLLEAARNHKSGSIDEDSYKKIQDGCINEIVAFQNEVGMPSITDGEYRRRVWSGGLTDALEGMGFKKEGILSFSSGEKEYGIPPSPYAEGKLRRRRNIVTDDFKFLKTTNPKGVPKVTIASPAVLHFWLGDGSFNPEIYSDRDAFFNDLINIYQEEIKELEEAGCKYLQLDDTALPCNCDEAARSVIKERGEDADELTDSYITLINKCIAGRPDGMFVGLHMCRGNLKGMWMAEGSYEPIADQLFNKLNVDTFFMEYDTERAGDFKPLRFLPDSKHVVLGLISTKTPILESKSDLKYRIEEAAQFAPLEQLSLSPQCGFSSGGGSGQMVTQDDVRKKLELVCEVAAEIWG